MYLTLFKRELALHIAGVGELFSVPALYVLMTSFYMLGQPFGAAATETGVSAMLWVAALFALGLTQYRIWEQDAADGTLEQWALLPLAMEWVVTVKLLAHWLMAGLPLVLLAPLLMLLLGAEVPAVMPLLLGTLALTSLGSVAGAISMRFASRQLLTLLLVFPLSVPVLIFGSASSLPGGEEGARMLLAYTLAVCPLAVASTALLLRFSLRH